MPTSVRIAKTSKEWDRLQKTDAKMVILEDGKEGLLIRSVSDWKEFLKDAKTNKNNPLANCEPEALREFTSKVRFGKHGVAGMYYGGLVNKLSFNNFRTLLAHFGMDLNVFEDHEHYYCAGKGDCGSAASHICTSNCFAPLVDFPMGEFDSLFKV
jgi:hypothetical protein